MHNINLFYIFDQNEKKILAINTYQLGKLKKLTKDLVQTIIVLL